LEYQFLDFSTAEFEKKNPTGIFGIKNGIRILLPMGVPEIGTKNRNSQPRWLGLSFMGAWTAGVMGGGSVSGGGDRRDLDEEESIEVGTIEPGVDVGTDDPNFTGLVATGVVLPPISRPPPMLKALLKVRWERLLMPEEMEKDDGGCIHEADVNGGRGISSTPVGSG
jgi:hypothetical protein